MDLISESNNIQAITASISYRSRSGWVVRSRPPP